MNTDPKYKLFRNFMINELEISKEDIENWCKDAVRVETSKLARRIIEGEGFQRDLARAAIKNTGLNYQSIKTEAANILFEEFMRAIKKSMIGG